MILKTMVCEAVLIHKYNFKYTIGKPKKNSEYIVNY